ncbi:Pyridine nucleotide-disulphide oxidoreductase,class I, active site [Ostreococcus tauri]|uniref:Glutathione reductase n=1 Tax=Ostreococcus tauri TaxID=70448 RepID=A0A090MBE0_OSTTA|nr:Pyridine nucleotide-disulphide oxidoreductase,class I, active site [Ostreococcus tauri]CEG00904.1 Pyridine nucleotide-disulphide oxidoreductase,class I, active site [Ostreococcus tauri]|eukprot:XP_022840660.1 Pyridine nucleotide-disulphide oxidoreductase,class I, active site [Ostreococcus tauri]
MVGDSGQDKDYDFDIFVIGGGSGGVRASRLASTAGAKVGLCEMPYDPVSSEQTGGLGGTCVIRGCVPKKLFVFGSEFSAQFEDATGFGWDIASSKFDWQRLLNAKMQEIQRLNGIYKKLLHGSGVTTFEGAGKLIDEHTVEISGKKSTERITARDILIATGGRAHVPDIPGAHLGITSDEALSLLELPEKILIIGSGYIAVEFAGIFAGLDVTVDLVYRQPLPLRGFDDDLRRTVKTNLQSRGITQHADCQVFSLSKDDTGRLAVETTTGVLKTDVVLFATGRVPNTSRPSLGLDTVGVDISVTGAIKVDEYSRTNVSNIWAVGDVTNRVNLTPVALMEGMAFVDTVVKGVPTKPEYDNIPCAVFSQPPVASVGLSEQDAIARGHKCDIYTSAFTPMKYSLSGRNEKALMKLVVETYSQRVLGVHMVGPDAAEIMQGFATALKCGATKQQFDQTVGIHPSSAEEFVTMRTMTRQVGGDAQRD